jgi:hypothetical protein
MREQTAAGAQQPTQMSGGQIAGQRVGAMDEQGGLRFEDTLNSETRVALEDFEKAARLCERCADECLGDAGMEQCARLCRDVADLATLNAQFISRDSLFGADIAETFAYAAEECEQECSQYPHEHCQECASVLRRATDSTWAMLNSFEHIPQDGQPYQQSQLQQY